MRPVVVLVGGGGCSISIKRKKRASLKAAPRLIGPDRDRSRCLFIRARGFQILAASRALARTLIHLNYHPLNPFAAPSTTVQRSVITFMSNRARARRAFAASRSVTPELFNLRSARFYRHRPCGYLTFVLIALLIVRIAYLSPPSIPPRLILQPRGLIRNRIRAATRANGAIPPPPPPPSLVSAGK